MGIRESLNKNPQITTGITAGIIILALLVILYQIFGGSGGGAAAGNTKRYFTTDTSSEAAALKAKFLDDTTKLAPFPKDGKEAVAVLVYSCDGGKTEKVAYFSRYTKAAKDRIEAANAKAAEAAKSGRGIPPEIAMMGGPDGAEQEVLIPGQAKWATGAAAMKVMAEFQFGCAGDQLVILPQP
jgi:hypothetical protein